MTATMPAESPILQEAIILLLKILWNDLIWNCKEADWLQVVRADAVHDVDDGTAGTLMSSLLCNIIKGSGRLSNFVRIN